LGLEGLSFRRVEELDDNFLREVARDEGHRLVHVFQELPSPLKMGVKVDDLDLNPAIKQALKRRGIERLYKFQEEAVKSIKSKNNTLIVAGTGTGKTEAFLLPILDDIIENPFGGVKALLVYPTKALARDQISRINSLAGMVFGVRALVFDGDTSERDRKRIFSMPPPILVTNPDMIHVSLMYSNDFKKLISKVEYIVLDDMHVYNGVFGTHVLYVLRRLRRFIDTKPVFIGTSATIGNPGEFSKIFFGESARVIAAETGRRNVMYHVMVRSVARSKIVEAISILRKCLEHDMKTIIFADSHKAVELIRRIGLRYGVDIKVHRAGLLPEERKSIERGLWAGDIKAVAATPTLELGIDIGDLDSVILLNIPPTFSKYIQRTGRCGRRGQKAYIFTILGDDPISQYYENFPEDFFNRSLEPIALDPTNDEIAKVQLLAMAKDMPFRLDELNEFERKVAYELVRNRLLRSYRRLYRCSREGIKYLRQRMSLRGVGEIVRIYDIRGRFMGYREMPMALKELFPGAVYLHGGNVYISMELSQFKAIVKKMPPDFDLLTTPLYYSEPSEFKEYASKEIYGVSVSYGELKVRDVVYGYVIKDFKSGAILKEEVLEKEYSYQFKTKGLLLEFPSNADWNLMENAEAFHAIEHVLISAGETLVGASLTDMGGISFPTGHIFIYDAFPGGSGITKLLLKRLKEAFLRAYRILSKCRCIDGCPKCIFSPYCGNNNKFLSRRRALVILEDIMFEKRKIPLVKSEISGKPIV